MLTRFRGNVVMKTVYLVRHGKAVGGDETMPDFERSLIERGVKDATTVAGRLSTAYICPSLIISSPAPRALETAKIFAGSAGYLKKKIRTRKAMYEQSEGALFAILKTLDDNIDDVMLVGHNPSIEDLAFALARKLKATFPTCGTAGIEFNVDSWADITEQSGKVLFFETPSKSPKPLTGKFIHKALTQKLTDFAECLLADIDPDAAAKTKKTIAGASEEIARAFVRKRKKLKK